MDAADLREALGCAGGDSEIPSRDDCESMIGMLLSTVGACDVEALLRAAGRLVSGDSAVSPALQARLSAALRRMSAAEQVHTAMSGGLQLAWSAIGGGTAAEAQQVTASAAAFSKYFGPADFRRLLRDNGSANWRRASPEAVGRIVGLESAEVGWASLPVFSEETEIPDFDGLPTQVRRILAELGTPLDDDFTTWSLTAARARSINVWLGRQSEAEDDDDQDDPEQRAVIEAPVGERLIVEAAPGSGKTRVACARVANLITRGVSPSRIWMISFTRAAVAELRARVALGLEHPEDATDVEIGTLDSLSGRLQSGYAGWDGDQDDASFEEGLRTTLNMLESRDRGLLGYLSTFEHLILDEAQDFTDARRDLVLALIRSLNDRCGVTIFEDPAQSIYGWQGDAQADAGLCRVLETGASQFRRLRLLTDHRTRDEQLKMLKTDLRLTLSQPNEHAAYDEMRRRIEAHAVPSVALSRPETASSSTLILFRSRGDLLSAAGRWWTEGVPARVRLTQRDRFPAGWIGALLGGAQTASLSRADFGRLWEELWPRPATLTADEGWRRLKRAVGNAHARTIDTPLDLVKLATLLAAETPPEAISSSVVGRAGPVLSTIHGSKGQEAEHVVVGLPRSRGGQSSMEARILYVAATRAKAGLSFASTQGGFSAGVAGRVWMPWRGDHARVEIGLDDDVDLNLSAFGAAGSDASAVSARRASLWRLNDTVTPVTAVSAQGGRYNLLADQGAESGSLLGVLSPQVSGSLREIGRRRHGGGRPSHRLAGLFMVGCRTVARIDGEGAPNFGTAPVVAGMARVFFNSAGEPAQQQGADA